MTHLSDECFEGIFGAALRSGGLEQLQISLEGGAEEGLQRDPRAGGSVSDHPDDDEEFGEAAYDEHVEEERGEEEAEAERKAPPRSMGEKARTAEKARLDKLQAARDREEKKTLAAMKNATRRR